MMGDAWMLRTATARAELVPETRQGGELTICLKLVVGPWDDQR